MINRAGEKSNVLITKLIKNTTDFRNVVVIISRIDNRRIIHVKAQQLDDSSIFFNDIIKSDCFSTDENQTTR